MLEQEEAVLNMLRRYKVLRIEDLSSGLLDFSWSQLISPSTGLAERNMIALRRVGLSYQIRPMNQEWTLGEGQQHEEPPAHHR